MDTGLLGWEVHAVPKREVEDHYYWENCSIISGERSARMEKSMARAHRITQFSVPHPNIMDSFCLAA
jgi:hypothetical protein